MGILGTKVGEGSQQNIRVMFRIRGCISKSNPHIQTSNKFSFFLFHFPFDFLMEISMFFGNISTEFSGHFAQKKSNLKLIQPLSPKGMRTFCSYDFKCASHLVICCGIIKHEEDISCSVCNNYCYELATSRCFHNL